MRGKLRKVVTAAAEEGLSFFGPSVRCGGSLRG